MIQLTKRHTGLFLKEEILKCFDAFNVDILQLYSSTTDNGSNMIKMAELIKGQQEEELFDNREDNDEEESSDTDIELEIASLFSVVRCAAHTLQLAAYDVIKTISVEIEECRAVIKTLRTRIRSDGSQLNLPTLDNVTRWNSTYLMINSLHSMKHSIENDEDYN